MIQTPRLLLRRIQPGDLPAFADQNADPLVMQYLGGAMLRADSDAYAARAERHWAEFGFGKWAVEVPGVAPFIGMVGLSHLRFASPFGPAVEVAWRLHRDHWGRGYASEAARAAIADGFERVGLTDIVALTALGNFASARVMERLGMTRTIEFDHPLLAADSPLRRHIVYRLARG